MVVVLGNPAEVDIAPEQVAALTRNVEDMALVGGDDALGADVREVGVGDHVHHAPGMVGDLALVRGADGLAHARMGAVTADDVFCADRELLALVLARAAAQTHLDGVLALADGEVDELVTVVGGIAGGLAAHELAEVVEDARLVDDQVGELRDTLRVVVGDAAAHNVLRGQRVRGPKGRLGDAVGLVNDLVGEPERREGLDRPGLDTVSVTEFEASAPLLDEASRDLGKD